MIYIIVVSALYSWTAKSIPNFVSSFIDYIYTKLHGIPLMFYLKFTVGYREQINVPPMNLRYILYQGKSIIMHTVKYLTTKVYSNFWGHCNIKSKNQCTESIIYKNSQQSIVRAIKHYPCSLSYTKTSRSLIIQICDILSWEQSRRNSSLDTWFSYLAPNWQCMELAAVTT